MQIAPMTQVLTANRLGDGRVVFLTPSGNWSPQLDDARTVNDDHAAAEMTAVGVLAEAQCAVIGPYLIEVVEQEGRLRAATIREAIRAAGPTVQAGQF